MVANSRPVGAFLKEWRQRRHRSQLDLALEADVSTKHLSFLETGRSQPSREMLLHLAELLEMPLRDRNSALVAAGFAPVFPEHSLEDPALEAARRAVDLVLKGHEPYPALAVDRHWNMIAANQATQRMLGGVDAALLQPPISALRVSLHPAGLGPQIVNFTEWREHLVARLRRQFQVSADPVLEELVKEMESYPVPEGSNLARAKTDEFGGVVVPLQLRTPAGVLSFFSTTTIFGTPMDVTLSELAVEAFFPADAQTAALLR